MLKFRLVLTIWVFNNPFLSEFMILAQTLTQFFINCLKTLTVLLAAVY